MWAEGPVKAALVESPWSSSTPDKTLASLEDGKNIFSQKMGPRGEQMICILNENNLYDSRQRRLRCHQVGGDHLCVGGFGDKFCMEVTANSTEALWRGESSY